MRAFWSMTLLALLVGRPSSVLHGRAQSTSDTAGEQAAAQLARLTPEERIGQLFMISFQGSDASSGSPVHSLITKYHVGGIVLLAKNDNILDNSSDPSATTQQVSQMVSEFIDATLPHTTACVMPGCEIDSFSPVENVRAMIDTARSRRGRA